MDDLRAEYKLRKQYRIRSTRIIIICDWNRNLCVRVDQGFLRWLEHVCRMSNEKKVKKAFNTEVDGVRGRMRFKLMWMVRANKFLNNTGFNVEEAIRVASNGGERGG